jgi:hypothetical protein
VQARSVDYYELGIVPMNDAAYGVPGGLWLRGCDDDLLTDQCIGKRGFPGIRPADKACETRTELC